MRKKLFTALLLGLVLSLCGVAGAFASYDEVSAWTPMAGWRDTTVVVSYDNEDGKGVNIYQKSGTDFTACYTEKAFYIDGFEFRFWLNYGGNAGNLKIIFSCDTTWWLDSDASFSIDMAYRANNKCSITHNTTNPNGYNNLAKPAGPDAPLYWDGSQENVFKMYFKDDGLLYFSVNGVELDSSSKNLDTARLEEMGILESFINGKGYLQIWGQTMNARCVLDVRTAPVEMAEPQFAEFGQDASWKVEAGSVLSALDGVRMRSFKSADGKGFSIAKTEDATLKNAYVKLNLAAEENEAVDLLFGGNGGNEIRLSVKNAAENNVELAMAAGGKETVLYTGTHALSFMDLQNPSYTESVSLQIRRVGVYYKLVVNEALVDCDLKELTAFIEQNYDNEACKLTIRTNGESIVKAVAVKSLEDASFVSQYENTAGSSAVITADGSNQLIYSPLDGGAYQVINTASRFWMDSFGVKFRMDKYDDSDNNAFNVILSSAAGWYETEQAPALILAFVREGENTKISIRTYDGNEETECATASSADFSWKYDVENNVNFGYTNYGWMLRVNNRELTLSGNLEEALVAVQDSFASNIAYLQLESEGGAGTTISISGYSYMVEAYIAPDGWQQGHYLVAPNWGEASPDTEATFSLAGEGYTAEKNVKVPFDGFRMDFALAPGNAVTQMSVALSDGSTDWYNTCWSIGVMMTYDPAADMVNQEEIQIGIIFANPDEGLESYRVNNITVPFQWYEKNSMEIRLYRGAYQFLLNGEEIFSNFDSYVQKIKDAYIDNNAELQFFISGDTTIRVYETTEIETVDPPTRVLSEVSKYDGASYEAGKEISIDLTKLFKSEISPLSFTVNVGSVENGVWKYTPDQAGTLELEIVANDGTQSSMPLTLTLNVTGGGGCGSAVTCGNAVLFAAALLAGVPLLMRRRKRDE